MKNTFYAIVLLLLTSCTDQKLSEISNSYEILELLKVADCSVYAMKFEPSSEVLFKLNTSGSCNNIESPQIIDAFEEILSNSVVSKKNNIQNGKIILLEYPSQISLEVTEVVSLTERILKSNLSYELTATNSSKLITLKIDM